MAEVAGIIAQSEKLDEEKKYTESFELLEKAYKDKPTEFEITWRLARAYPITYVVHCLHKLDTLISLNKSLMIRNTKSKCVLKV